MPIKQINIHSEAFPTRCHSMSIIWRSLHHEINSHGEALSFDPFEMRHIINQHNVTSLQLNIPP